MNFKQTSKLLKCVMSLMLVIPATVSAGAESGFYIGAGVGEASTEVSSGNSVQGGFDASDTGKKVFAGYNFGLVPFIDLAVEASYADFGTHGGSYADGTPVYIDLSGINAFGLVGYSFGPFGIFAKAGMINWDSKTMVGPTPTDNSGTDAAYGLGAKFSMGSFAVRAEYETYDVASVSDLSMLSVSAVFTF